MLFLLSKGFPEFLVAHFSAILGMVDDKGTPVLFPLGDGLFRPCILAKGLGRTLGGELLFCEARVGGYLRAGFFNESS